MATNDAQPGCRVGYVGTGRIPKLIFGFPFSYENEVTWHQRQAAGMGEVCGIPGWVDRGGLALLRRQELSNAHLPMHKVSG